MIRALITIALFASLHPAIGRANNSTLPAEPNWQTDAANCYWNWREGGGIGLWTETCRFNERTWQVVWDEGHAAFVTKKDGTVMGIAVQAFVMPAGANIRAISKTLISAGLLDANAACIWEPIAPRPAPRTMAFHVLRPADQTALSPTASGDIPEPACGPYGASTHGVRYFLTDLRWPDRAIFVDEGQESPLFDPASLTLLP
ncbi:hypothetical protein HAT86_15740 [Roseovarius gahaiensis]|uniref:Uncharacterized protein n=1 Tax=Roseovarius gahaiensis TaxID=2716691 RepID=A0A967EK80_9RHOB|nr:hypothetical protein [Roseovarius gahaiensis]NHQ75902.1 hypothetical protein [Roseovarius gahaiensis]